MGSDKRTDWENDNKVIKPSSKNYNWQSRFIWPDKNSTLVQFFLYKYRKKPGK